MCNRDGSCILGYERIKMGKAKRMLCGSTESEGKYVWSGFEALRIICSDSNDKPERASRPMSRLGRFCSRTGSGALVLESLDSATERNAKIYAEIVGSDIVNGGQRNGGSITANNLDGTVRASRILKEAKISGGDIDLICGHLTSTIGDYREIDAWTKALERQGIPLLRINTLESMIGQFRRRDPLSLSACLQMYHSIHIQI